MRGSGDTEHHSPPPARSPGLAELERRVVATILSDPRAVRSLRRPLCPWCVFADPRNALLVAHATETRKPVGLQYLAWLLWRKSPRPTTHAAAAEHVTSLVLGGGVEDLRGALVALCADGGPSS